MSILDDKLLSDSRFRCETITYYLFSGDDALRGRIYDRLQGSTQFSEFLPARSNNIWVSYNLMRQQFAFPHKIGADAGLSADDVLYLVELEERFRERRQIQVSLLDLAEQVHKLSPQELSRKLGGVVKVRPSVVTELNGAEYYRRIESRPKGVITGVRQFDELTRGIGYGTVSTILGWTGSYKTIFKNCINYNALLLGYNVTDINLEMTRDQLYFRYLARHSYHPKFLGRGSPVNSLLISKAELSPEQKAFLFGVVEPDFKQLPGKLFLLEQGDVPGWDFLSLRSFFKSLGDIDVVSLDYIQVLMFGAVTGFRDPREAGNWVINEFRKLAVGSENPDEGEDTGERKIVLLVSQSNRDGWTEAVENEGAFTLRAMSDLNMLERASHYVFSVFVDDSLRASGECKMQMMKHRSGEPVCIPIPVAADPRFSVVGDNIEGYRQESPAANAVIDLFADGGISF